MAAIRSIDFTRAFRAVPAAVSIVTTKVEGFQYGMTATAVTPVSAEPPQIQATINSAARCNAAIVRAGIFAVNFLPTGNTELARLFSQSGFDLRSRFQMGEWMEGTTGAPLLKGAIASFDCEVAGQYRHGTHHILVGRVVWIASREDGAPLVYRGGTYLSFSSETPLLRS